MCHLIIQLQLCTVSFVTPYRWVKHFWATESVQAVAECVLCKSQSSSQQSGTAIPDVINPRRPCYGMQICTSFSLQVQDMLNDVQ